MASWLTLLLPSLPLLLLGIALLAYGIPANREARRQLEWADEMRRKYPWLRRVER